MNNKIVLSRQRSEVSHQGQEAVRQVTPEEFERLAASRKKARPAGLRKLLFLARVITCLALLLVAVLSIRHFGGMVAVRVVGISSIAVLAVTLWVLRQPDVESAQRLIDSIVRFLVRATSCWSLLLLMSVIIGYSGAHGAERVVMSSIYAVLTVVLWTIPDWFTVNPAMVGIPESQTYSTKPQAEQTILPSRHAITARSTPDSSRALQKRT